MHREEIGMRATESNLLHWSPTIAHAVFGRLFWFSFFRGMDDSIRMRVFLPLCFGALLAGAALHADEGALPAGGVSLVETGTAPAFKVSGGPGLVFAPKVVEAEGEPFKQALRVQTLATTPTPYSVQLYAPTAGTIHAGDVLFARFYLRCLDTKQETGMGSTELVIEQGGPDYKKLITFPGGAGKEWTEFRIPFVATKESIGGMEIAAGKAHVLFRLGYGPQTVEIGGVEILNFGNKVNVRDLPQTDVSYTGREADAPWRKEAEERIEKFRKGDLVIVVKGADGKPLPGAGLRVEMTQHAFGFGSAVSAEMLLAQTPDGDKYRDVVLSNFNRVVLENDLKWGSWEANRQRAMHAVKWLRDHGIEVRGHNLVWPSWHFLPRDLEGLKGDPDALRKRIDDHITDEVGALKGECVEWDVVNELFANHDAPDILGKESLAGWFKLAHEADPDAKLFINDYDTIESGRTDNPHTDAFEMEIRQLLEEGAPVSGIGIQSHFGWALPAPAAVHKGFERFAKLGLEMEVTEEDVDVTDEQLQADYTRDYMTLAFSEPSVVGFLSWGFWEGRHWRADAAYYRKDWSMKPAAQEWRDLVMNRWWTRAAGVTDARGEYKVRGFFGDYKITVVRGGVAKTVLATLKKEGGAVEITME